MHVVNKLGLVAALMLAFAGCGDGKQEEAGREAAGGAERGGSRAAWSPTGTDILFVSNRSGNNDIWLLSADATEPVNLTRHEGGDNWPEWSPDGKRVVFQSMRNGKFDLFMVDIDGTDQTQLTTDAEHDYLPAWSPDGKEIVFVSWRSEEGDTGRANHIYAMKPDGSEQHRIVTESPGVSSGAAFSPDGRYLVLSRKTGERAADVVIAPREGGEERWVTSDSSAFNGSAVFSPDGKWIAFYSDRDSISSLDIVRADGSDRRTIVTEGQNWYPRWSPDGKWLVYVVAVKTGGDNLDVRAVAIETGETVPLFTGKANDSEARWRP